jgi:hypothetical protein
VSLISYLSLFHFTATVRDAMVQLGLFLFFRVSKTLISLSRSDYKAFIAVLQAASVPQVLDILRGLPHLRPCLSSGDQAVPERSDCDLWDLINANFVHMLHGIEKLCALPGGDLGTAYVMGHLMQGDISLASLAFEWSAADKQKCIVSESRLRDAFTSGCRPTCSTALCVAALRSRLELIGPVAGGYPALSAVQLEHRAMLEEYLGDVGN